MSSKVSAQQNKASTAATTATIPTGAELTLMRQEKASKRAQERKATGRSEAFTRENRSNTAAGTPASATEITSTKQAVKKKLRKN